MNDVLLLIPEITRGMKSLGSKSLLKIKNSTTVLEYQINQLRTYNSNCKIFIGTGFDSEKVKKICSKYKNIEFIDNPKFYKTNQSKILASFVDQYSCNSLLVISNGILFRNNPFKTLDHHSSKIFVIDKPKNNFNIGCSPTEKIHYLFYDLPSLWSECVMFDTLALEMIKKIKIEQDIEQMYLFELINKLLDRSLAFTKNTISKKDIMKIESIKDISAAKLFV